MEDVILHLRQASPAERLQFKLNKRNKKQFAFLSDKPLIRSVVTVLVPLCVVTILLITIWLLRLYNFSWYGHYTTSIEKHSSSNRNVPSKEQKIPKIIHQTSYHSTINDLPKPWQASIELMKQKNVDYQFRYYNDAQVESYILKHFGSEKLVLYQSINPQYGAARADFFRYLVTYNEGGIYLDIKSSINPRYTFSDIIKSNDEFFISTRRLGSPQEEHVHTGWGEFRNWFIITKPKHPFLKRVIQRVCENIKFYSFDANNRSTWGKQKVLEMTGPILYTNAISSLIQELVNSNKTIYSYTFIPRDLNGALWYDKHNVDHIQLFGKQRLHYSYVNIPLPVINTSLLQEKGIIV